MTINLDWYRKFLVIFAVAVFYTSVCDYTERYGFTALQWIYVMTALTAPVLLQAAFTYRYRFPPLVYWGAGYLIISIIWYFPSVQDTSAYRQIRIRVLSTLFMFLILFIVSRPEEQRLARLCVALGVLFGTGMNIYEQFHPMTWSPVAGRSMGLYPNIDETGCALVLGMIIGQGALPPKLRLPFSIVAGIGIVTTFSRASILGWIIVNGFWMVRSGIKPAQIRRGLVTLALLFGFFSSPYWSSVQHKLEARGAITPDVIQRLQFFSQGNQSDSSTSERKAITAAAWDLFVKHPLLGEGTGAITGRNLENFTVGPHNMYLALMVDHGIIGAFILPLMLLAMVWGCRRDVFDVAAPMVLFISVFGFFSHTLLFDRYLLLTVALTGAMVFSRRPAANTVPAVAPARNALQLAGTYA